MHIVTIHFLKMFFGILNVLKTTITNKLVVKVIKHNTNG